MGAYYSRYLHWSPVLIALFSVSLGTAALVDALRSRVEPLDWAGQPQDAVEVDMLKEPLLNTVTIQRSRVIARNGKPVQLDSTASARIIQDLEAAAPHMVKRLPKSWLGLDTWPEKLGESIIGLSLLWVGLVGFRLAYRARYTTDFREWGHHAISGNPLFSVEDSQLRLLRPYPFAASLISRRDLIAADELTGIHLGGDSAVLAGREVLYFTYEQRRSQSFCGAQSHSIGQPSRCVGTTNGSV